jgi:hypothetical protein
MGARFAVPKGLNMDQITKESIEHKLKSLCRQRTSAVENIRDQQANLAKKILGFVNLGDNSMACEEFLKSEMQEIELLFRKRDEIDLQIKTLTDITIRINDVIKYASQNKNA